MSHRGALHTQRKSFTLVAPCHADTQHLLLFQIPTYDLAAEFLITRSFSRARCSPSKQCARWGSAQLASCWFCSIHQNQHEVGRCILPGIEAVLVGPAANTALAHRISAPENMLRFGVDITYPLSCGLLQATLCPLHFAPYTHG